MAILRYSDKSLIDEVHIVKDEAGRETRAYLHAREGTDPEALSAAVKYLGAAGFITTPFNLDGTPVLEVRGFRKGDKLTAILKEAGVLGANTGKEDQKGDKAAVKDKVKKATLRAAGLAYYVGDVSFFTYGVRDRNFFTIASALGYFAGTNVLAIFGGTDQSPYQVKDAAQKMQAFLRKEQIPATDTGALHEVTKERNKSLWSRFVDTCRQYPSEVFSFIYIITGMMIAYSTKKDLTHNKALKEKYTGMLERGTAGTLTQQEQEFLRDQLEHGLPRSNKAKYMDIGLGSMTAAASLFPLLVKEKAREEGEPKRTGLAGVWDWMRERPLKVQGLGYLASTLCHVGSTFTERRESSRTIGKYGYIKSHASHDAPNSPIRNKELFNTMKDAVGEAEHKKASLIGRVIFVLANLAAEVLIYFSSKGHGEGVKADHSVEKSVAALAANAIASQPAEKQDAMIERLSGFLASPEVMGGTSESIASNIRMQLSVLKNNPWAQAAGTTVANEEAKAPDSQETTYTKEHAPAKNRPAGMGSEPVADAPEQSAKEASEDTEKPLTPVTQVSSSSKWQHKTPQKTIDPQPLSEKPIAASPGLGI